MSYTDSTKWFENSEIRRYLCKLVDPYQKHTILEIGCFEGVGSAYFSDVFLENPESSLTCVDPFLPIDQTTPQVSNTTKSTFYDNIDKSDQRAKIRVFEETSDSFFSKNTDTYSIIYIDGDHHYEAVKRDLQNAYKCLESGGILWCDDYAWSDDIQQAVKEFVDENPSIKLIHSGCQIAFQK